MDPSENVESDTALFNRLSPYIWVIEIYEKQANSKGEKSKIKIWETFSGFSVHKSNLILACYYTSKGPISSDGLCIRAKRVTEDEAFMDCIVKHKTPRVDMSVLMVKGFESDSKNVLELGKGDLVVGERIFHIGNPLGFQVSFLRGDVAFKCIEVKDYKLNNEKCEYFNTSAAKFDYRIMGNYFNPQWFRNSDNKSVANYEYFKDLHPKIPIIQLNGMLVKSGTYGGPLFNNRGEVVGVMYGGITACPIAIHVSVVKKIEDLIVKSEKKELEKSDKMEVTDDKGTETQGVLKKAKLSA